MLYLQLQCIEYQWFVDQGAGCYKIMISFKTSRVVSGVWLLNPAKLSNKAFFM